MGDGKKRIGVTNCYGASQNEGEHEKIRPMFRALKSNSPLSAPRDDTAPAGYGNTGKRKVLSTLI